MATTFIGKGPNSEAAENQSGITGTLQSLIGFWNTSVPTPIKWVVGAIVMVMVLNRGIVRLGTAELIALAVVYVAYRKWYPKTEESSNSSPTANDRTTERRTSKTETLTAGKPSAQPRPVMPIAPEIMAGLSPPIPAVAGRRVYTPLTLRQIPVGQRAADITTSLTLSLFAVALVTAAVHLATPLLPKSVDVAFFGTVTLVAACVLIVPAKMWEGKASDNLLRRLIQGALGLCVGAFAFGVQRFLMLSDTPLLHTEGDGVFSGSDLGRISVVNSQGLPTMAGFMIFFGLLFLARRWWWQADSFRKSRFRISSSLVSLVLGFVLTALLPFPNNLGATWALAISAVVQLSAGWTPQEERLLAPAPGSGMGTPMLTPARHPAVASPASQKA
jgi:hypothetical protein